MSFVRQWMPGRYDSNTVIRIGNASSPRWYDLSPVRLEEYIDRLSGWGASTTELVLHRGEFDDRTARVHVLEEDWIQVFERYRSHGFTCNVHAPLDPRFKFDRFESDPEGIKREFLPVVHAVADFSQRQGEDCTLVVHGASGGHNNPREATAAFLSWVSGELTRSGSGRIALELRSPGRSMSTVFDRSRRAIAEFIRWLGDERIGICWDLAHDWEASESDPAWTQSPDPEFLELVNHVHLHDASIGDRLVHHPLQSGRIPWQSMLKPLVGAKYDSAITLEIRYRLAISLGEPWHVLGGSYAMLRGYLNATGNGEDHPAQSTETVLIEQMHETETN